MPRLDELLGVAAVAAGGMLVAIAFQSGTRSDSVCVRCNAPTSAATEAPVRLEPVQVIARRSVELARLQREDKLHRERAAKDPARPDA